MASQYGFHWILDSRHRVKCITSIWSHLFLLCGRQSNVAKLWYTCFFCVQKCGPCRHVWTVFATAWLLSSFQNGSQCRVRWTSCRTDRLECLLEGRMRAVFKVSKSWKFEGSGNKKSHYHNITNLWCFCGQRCSPLKKKNTLTRKSRTHVHRGIMSAPVRLWTGTKT